MTRGFFLVAVRDFRCVLKDGEVLVAELLAFLIAVGDFRSVVEVVDVPLVKPILVRELISTSKYEVHFVF